MLYTSLKWSSVSFLAPVEGAAAAAGAGAGAGAALGLGAAGAGLASSAGRGEGIGLTAGWLAPASFEAEHTPPTAKGGGGEQQYKDHRNSTTRWSLTLTSSIGGGLPVS